MARLEIDNRASSDWNPSIEKVLLPVLAAEPFGWSKVKVQLREIASKAFRCEIVGTYPNMEHCQVLTAHHDANSAIESAAFSLKRELVRRRQAKAPSRDAEHSAATLFTLSVLGITNSGL